MSFEPGDTIDLERLRVISDYLPPPMWEHRDRFFFEGMELEIGPCFRGYEAPAFFGEASEKFCKGQAKVLQNGGLGSYTAGLPFPPETISPDGPPGSGSSGPGTPSAATGAAASAASSGSRI